MGGLIGITRPNWTGVTGLRSAPDDVERYVRYEFREPRADWLRVAPVRTDGVPASCEGDARGDWTLFERLARALASFF